MSSIEKRPEAEFYENPYLPCEAERQDLDELPLRPIEALDLIVKHAGELSASDLAALRSITEGEYHPDQEVDLFAYQSTPTLDGGYHDDEY